MFSIWRLRDRAGRDLPYLHGTFLVLGVLFPIGSLLATVLAPFNIGHYDINGVTVSGPEFIRSGGLLVFWGVSLALAVLAHGIWGGQSWTRLFIFWSVAALFVLALALAPETFSLLPALFEEALILAILYWYLYRKRRTVAYYNALSDAAPQAA